MAVVIVSRPRIELNRSIRWLLGGLAIGDLVAIVWLISEAGGWLAETDGFLSVITLGGRRALVLGLAAGAFLVLACLAVLTDLFTSVSRLQLALMILAGSASVVALAGALSTVLLLVTGAVVLGFVARPLRRR